MRHLHAVPDFDLRSAEDKLLEQYRERSPERQLRRRKRSMKGWAKFMRVNPRRPSHALRAFENEVVVRKVKELCERHDSVTADDLCAAYPGLFNRKALGGVLKRLSYGGGWLETRHTSTQNRYAPRSRRRHDRQE